MSRQNVERIRAAFAGTTAGDFSYLSGLKDESCECRLPPDFPGTQGTRGPEGILSVVFRDRAAALEAVEPSE